ncbi:hypothetical protein PIROE2DRAFT_65309, partial [Piromyces sp. E2]
TFIYAIEARYDVYFNPEFFIYLDTAHYTQISGCRYNSDRIVYCEVKIEHYERARTEKEVHPCKDDHLGDYGLPDCKQKIEILYLMKNYYRIRMPLTLENFTSRCKESFKSTSHFKNVVLKNEKNQVTNIPSDQTKRIKKDYELPASFNTNGNNVYTLEFTTKNNCLFKGRFNKIYATNIGKKEEKISEIPIY